MNILHHSSSFHRKLEFALVALLVPVAALAAPPAAAPAAATTRNKSLSSLLDNSPYVPADYVPYQPAAPVAKPTVAPMLTLQYKGFSQEGDVTYYIIADTRSGQSHWLKTGETWYLPNGGYVQLTAADGESIMLDTSSQQGVVIGLYHDASKPIAAVPTNTPTVVLSTDTGSPRGGKDNTSPAPSQDPGNGPGPGFNGGGRGGRGNGPGNGGGFNGPGNGGPGGGFNANRGGFNGPGNGPSGGNNAAAGGNGG